MESVFDPNTLISPPFRPCPRCRAEQFGIHIVYSNAYSRACRTCGHRGDRVALPQLARKVIYVDQFAISDMMKTLNSGHPAHARASANPFWRDLFEVLDRLVQMQLVICPFSEVHINESAVTQDADVLRDMYERLALMVGFTPTAALVERQLSVALRAWLEGREPQYDLTAAGATSGGLNDWKEFPLISARLQLPQYIIDSIRAFRDGVRAKIEQLFADLVGEASRGPFKQWFEHERRISGQAVLQAERLFVQRLREIGAHRANRLYNSIGLKQFRLIEERLDEEGVPDGVQPARIAAFLESDIYMNFHANRIQALAWAALDQAVAGGQRLVHYAGMSNDIQMLTLMPFCDAMFIDNGCRALWGKVPGHYKRVYRNTRLFSSSNREEFMNHLRDIEAQADPAVLAAAREVYGEPRPFTEMYDRRR